MKQAKTRIPAQPPSVRLAAGLAVAALATTALSAVVAMPGDASAAAVGAAEESVVTSKTPTHPAVLSSRIIGHSVKGRPIRAFELGERSADVTAVLVGRQHGNEPAGETILFAHAQR